MYLRFAEQHRWKVEVLSQTRVDVGGLKDVTAIIEGDKVYSQMKYESRRAPGAAGAGDGDAGAGAYVGDHGGGAAGGGRGGHQDRGEGSAHRHVLLVGAGRADR